MTADRTPLPGYVHPSETAYRDGCRCEPCAFRRYRVRKRHKIRSHKGPVMVPSTPGRVVLQALIDEGYTKNLIMRVSGVDEHVILRVLTGGGLIDRDRLARIVRITRQTILDGAPDECHVPVTGSQRRLQALMRMGWSQKHLAGDDPAFQRVLTDICAGSRKRVTAGTHRRIEALYAKLSMTPGPSKIAKYERIKGFTPALAWDEDDLDDPLAEPHQDTPIARDREAANSEERYRLYLMGLSDPQIAERLGTTVTAIARWRHRRGLFREAS